MSPHNVDLAATHTCILGKKQPRIACSKTRLRMAIGDSQRNLGSRLKRNQRLTAHGMDSQFLGKVFPRGLFGNGAGKER